MSKAEDRAYKWYPNGDTESKKARFVFLLGYLQAEKDLELSPVDIMVILDISIKVLRECNNQKELIFKKYPEGEGYYEEILKRFKERKEK